MHELEKDSIRVRDRPVNAARAAADSRRVGSSFLSSTQFRGNFTSCTSVFLNNDNCSFFTVHTTTATTHGQFSHHREESHYSQYVYRKSMY